MNLIRFYFIISFSYAGIRFLLNWLIGLSGQLNAEKTFNFPAMSLGSILLVILWVSLHALVVYRFALGKKSALLTMIVVSSVIAILLIGPILSFLSNLQSNLDIVLLFVFYLFNVLFGLYLKQSMIFRLISN